MKIKTRKSAFETNSSSSHTLVLDMECELIKNPFDKDYNKSDELIIQGLELGWDWEDYFKPIDKIRCAYTAAMQYDEIEREDFQKMIYQVVFEYSKFKCIFQQSSDYYPYGYIDHQSVGEIDSIFSTKETLRQFIFGIDSKYCTGNDNGYDPRLKIPDGYDVNVNINEVSRFIIEHDLYQKLVDLYINLETYKSYPWVSLKLLDYDDLLQVCIEPRKFTPEAINSILNLAINKEPNLEIVFEM